MNFLSDTSVSSQNALDQRSSTQGRNFVCTLWDIPASPENYLEQWSKLNWVRYVKGQVEQCPSTGKKHLQFYNV